MNSKYFENKDCEFYPCHDMGHLNCLFCFCPLYSYEDCGGDFKIINPKDGKFIKDCSDCKIPHSENGYDYVIEKLKSF